jgi:hypothetical protein
MISIQPEPLHFPQPVPLQKMQLIATVDAGLDEGKNVG